MYLFCRFATNLKTSEAEINRACDSRDVTQVARTSSSAPLASTKVPVSSGSKELRMRIGIASREEG